MRERTKELIWILSGAAGLCAIAVLLCVLLWKGSSHGEDGRLRDGRSDAKLYYPPPESPSLLHGRLYAEVAVECRNGVYEFRNAEACTEGGWVTVREYSDSGDLRSVTEFSRGEVLAVRRSEEESSGE